MAQHTVKIDDKIYTKLKAFCDLNKESVYKISNEAIEEYLNKIKFGDAPFMRYEHEKQQISQEPSAEIDKNTEKQDISPKDLENSGMVVVESVKSDENGNVEIHMKKLDGPDSIQTKFTVHNDGTVEMDKDKYRDTYNNFTMEDVNKAAEKINTETQRPKRRRL